MMCTSTRKKLISFIILFIIGLSLVQGQTQTYPESMVDQSYIPPSPNAQGFQSYGNDPVALFEGVPAISIPVYQVKCGSLSLPMTLSYNYNGFLPLQDAGWVGLGWNLNAGGVISRTVEGAVDNSENSGYNYGQYNLYNSIYLYNSPATDSFLERAYNNNLGYAGNVYDMAPDIFDAEFNGYSGKFFWISNTPEMLSYNKQLGISWPSPSSNFTITTEDGTAYTFGAMETTTSYYYGGADSTHITFTSAWHLSMVVSADFKDTIKLSYTSYTWQQAAVSYQTSYGLSAGTQADLGNDPLYYPIAPSIQTQILQSITCRNTRVSFIADATLRTDITGTYPRLKEIDVIDSITGNTVKKNMFSYEYFGQTSTNPASYEHLALKRYNSINLQLSNDSLTYNFKYDSEFSSHFPLKGTAGIDYWGYYNGGSASTILPSPLSPFYSPTPPSNATFSSGVIRTPNLSTAMYGALDTIVYPAGGYTAFQYQLNQFASTFGVAGPGICLKSSVTFSNNPTSPPLSQKNYTYLLDDGVTSSGVLTNIPNFNGPSFVIVNEGTANNYYIYKAANNSGGIGGINPKFYYQKVTESITSNGETHKSDHYFGSYPGLFLDVRETERIDYVNTPNTTLFSPIKKTLSAYNAIKLDSFYYAFAYIDSEYLNVMHTPKTWYGYSSIYNTWSIYWVFPAYQQTIEYDLKGDSITNTLNFYFNTTTRNLALTTMGTSDGQTITQKFKYPEDYSPTLTGNMVTARVLSPVIENETWLKQNSSDSVLISGNITLYDQSIYTPISEYSIETTSPIASLNNETISGGVYTSLLSDSRYILKEQIQYDANDNLNVANKASDIYFSYIWDYKHSQPIAKVSNALQADIAFTSFEADGRGGWTFTGKDSAVSTSPTGNYCYNLAQTSGNITKSGLTTTTYYIVSYWTTNSSALTITGTQTGYPIKGKTINGWTYFEHKITGQSSLTISGSGLIDELRLYPANAQMTTYTYTPLIGISSQCDPDNRITYYQYDGFGRVKVILDQDHNIIKTAQYHYNGETAE